jgi:hypothetical protein
MRRIYKVKGRKIHNTMQCKEDAQLIAVVTSYRFGKSKTSDQRKKEKRGRDHKVAVPLL